jgi:AcrR family transcriptional regulator
MKFEKRPYHHADLRAALIDEVLAALAAGEADGLSMRQLAARVGVSHTAAYAHFADKSALWRAVAAVGLERLRDALWAAVVDAPSPAAALTAAGLAYLAFARADRALYRVMFRYELKPSDGYAAEQSAYEVLQRAVAAVPFAGKPRPAERIARDAVTAWSLVHGLASLEEGGHFGALDAAAVEELTRHAVATMVRGLEAA